MSANSADGVLTSNLLEFILLMTFVGLFLIIMSVLFVRNAN